MNTKELLSTLSDAVTASGKSLGEIGKEPIFEYLKRSEVPKNLWEGLYEKLKNLHEPQTTAINQNSWHDSSWSEQIPDTGKQPRKKVFSEIKKIAG